MGGRRCCTFFLVLLHIVVGSHVHRQWILSSKPRHDQQTAEISPAEYIRISGGTYNPPAAPIRALFPLVSAAYRRRWNRAECNPAEVILVSAINITHQCSVTNMNCGSCDWFVAHRRQLHAIRRSIGSWHRTGDSFSVTGKHTRTFVALRGIQFHSRILHCHNPQHASNAVLFGRRSNLTLSINFKKGGFVHAKSCGAIRGEFYLQ